MQFFEKFLWCRYFLVSLHKNIRYEAYILYLVLYVGIQLF